MFFLYKKICCLFSKKLSEPLKAYTLKIQLEQSHYNGLLNTKQNKKIEQSKIAHSYNWFNTIMRTYNVQKKYF